MYRYKKTRIKRGKSTFIIEIKDSQNSTWQGIITNADKDESVCFRSELELFQLMEGVKSKYGNPDVTQPEGDNHHTADYPKKATRW